MRYYGITIGPIVETISSAAKPAGLWMASYFFSTLTRDLCDKISEIEGVDIISPFFPKEEQEIKEYGEGKKLGTEDGIGRFNDRVILTYCNNDIEKFEIQLVDVFEDIKKQKAGEIATCLNSDIEDNEIIDYIDKYINISCIGVDKIADGNVLKTVSSKLDALELFDHVRPSGSDPFIAAVLSDNEKVKKYSEFSGIRRVLENKNSNSIKELKSIAEYDGSRNEYKSSNYFAVVYADGDHMGKVIETLGGEEKTAKERQRDFSRKCMDYTVKSAKLITEYGGLPIYAGGDDILFLAPLYGKNIDSNDGRGISIFGLCNTISNEFNRVFKQERDELKKNGPSLSYGISINYYKYPLYEAVNDARRLLFGEAKREEDDVRIYNSLAIAMRKASGQKVELVIGQEDNASKLFIEILNDFIEGDKNIENSSNKEKTFNNIAHSMIFTLGNQKKVISKVWEKSEDSDKQKAILNNFFDSDSQNDMDLSKVCKLGEAIKNGQAKNLIRIQNAEENTFAVDGITAFLRICKFFIEKGEEMV